MMRRNPERCKSWPDCTCAEKWRQYQDAPAELFEHAGAVPILAATLACVAKRCPDRRFRDRGTIQLMHPIFAETERVQ